VVVIGGHLGLAALAIALHGWKVGGFVYLSALGFPALFTLWAIMFTNYIQHVHADPWSRHNHSRNFVSPLNNFFVFNNGYHTVHHEHPGVHWSKYPALHAEIAHEIHPALNEGTIVGYTFRVYVLGTFFSRFRTQQIGRAAYEVEGPQDLTTATIGDAAEVGVTAQSI
jgi:fatty acid desaturase